MAKLPSLPLTLESLRKAAQQPSDDSPTPTRRGRPGYCTACDQTVMSHFNDSGRWLGCPAGSEGTMFALVAVPAEIIASGNGDGTGPSATAKHTKTAKAYRYFVDAPPGGIDLDAYPAETRTAEERKRILAVINNEGPAGVLREPINSRSGVTPGRVSRHLETLRKSGLVRREVEK